MDASEQDLESQAGHGGSRRCFDDLTEPLLSDSQPVTISSLPPRSLAESVGMGKGAWESLIHDWSAHVREFLGEVDRMLGSHAVYQEQAAVHHETMRRMSRKLQLLTALNLLFLGAAYLAYRCGYIDGRPRSPASYILWAEVGLYTSQVLIRIAEQWQYMKEAPGEFLFKFDFENMPALKEQAGEQKWKEIQACSDIIRVMEDLQAIILMRQSQAVSSPSSFSE